MKWLLACPVLFGFLAAAGFALADEAVDAEIKALQGTWTAVSFEHDGKQTPAESLAKIKLTVEGSKYHFQNGTFSEHGEYQFHPDHDPKQLDIVVGDGADKGKVYVVIYKVKGDDLSICLQTDNKARPKEFTGAEKTGCVLEIWKRAAK